MFHNRSMCCFKDQIKTDHFSCGKEKYTLISIENSIKYKINNSGIQVINTVSGSKLF